MSNDDYRRAQLRDAQRRRRLKLSEEGRRQVNIFLSKEAINRLDALAAAQGTDRHTALDLLLRSIPVDNQQ